METPDVTKTQIIALLQPFVTALLGLLVAFNIDMTDGQQTAIMVMTGVIASAVSIALGIGDAVIRNGRAKAAGTLGIRLGNTVPGSSTGPERVTTRG